MHILLYNIHVYIHIGCSKVVALYVAYLPCLVYETRPMSNELP